MKDLLNDIADELAGQIEDVKINAGEDENNARLDESSNLGDACESASAALEDNTQEAKAYYGYRRSYH